MSTHKTALIVLHTHFEEIEAIATIDVLDRAGIDVTIASREAQLEVVGRSHIPVKANLLLDEALKYNFDIFILPGGPGTPALLADTRIIQAVQTYSQEGKHVAAICAAPSVLGKAGILKSKHFTAHPCVWDILPDVDRKHTVLTDGNLITAQGPAWTIAFGLAIVEALLGKVQADRVAEDLLLTR